jgi:alpha-ketoglutarate-dependent taurine dioxygenase
VIDDIVEVRKWLANIQLRILKPEYICMAPVEEGDVAMWDNYGVFHSAVDYPIEKYGPRTMHQANIGGSRGPIAPVPIPVA